MEMPNVATSKVIFFLARNNGNYSFGDFSSEQLLRDIERRAQVI